MSGDQRIVIRTSWAASFANMAPVAAIFLAAQFGGAGGVAGVTVIVVVITATACVRYLQYVVLTPQGLGIHWFGMVTVPWQQIRSVEMTNKYGGSSLSVFDLAENRSRRLPAPRGAFGVGTKETADARELIEQWWLACSGLPLPGPTMRTSPPAAPGGPDDPWRPPEL